MVATWCEAVVGGIVGSPVLPASTHPSLVSKATGVIGDLLCRPCNKNSAKISSYFREMQIVEITLFIELK